MTREVTTTGLSQPAFENDWTPDRTQPSNGDQFEDRRYSAESWTGIRRQRSEGVRCPKRACRAGKCEGSFYFVQTRGENGKTNQDCAGEFLFIYVYQLELGVYNDELATQ